MLFWSEARQLEQLFFSIENLSTAGMEKTVVPLPSDYKFSLQLQ